MKRFTDAHVLESAFLLLFSVVLVCCIRAQSRALTLESFFQSLVDRYDPSAPPKFEDLRRVTGQIESLRPEEITAALPPIFAALAHHDETIKAYAQSALYSISLRPDSATLLKKYVDVIGLDLTAPKPETRGAAIIILGGLHPTPPPDVVSIFLAFLRRRDAIGEAQGSAVIFELAHIAPEDPKVVAAVRDFLARTLDTKSRIDVLNALGTSRIKGAEIINMMVSSLNDTDQGVRLTAAQALAGMGQSALQQAEPALQRLANDPQQPAEVRGAAKEALRKLHASN